jgi:hypothetical protein
VTSSREVPRNAMSSFVETLAEDDGADSGS